MKILRLVTTAALLSLPVLANASHAQCNDWSIHCVTFAKPAESNPQQSFKGRYIKATATVNGESESVVGCFDDSSTLQFDVEAVQSGYVKVGDVIKAEYRQCKDKYCGQNVVAGTEEFTVTNTAEGGYSSNPNSYEVKLDGNYGLSCNPSFHKISMIHKRSK